ncbi:MAG: hypothetical protein K6E50_14820 [Lachnospiraceae bacterium]|nr:hypothetical protein [Lachnospiraceae bacterium]
MLSNIIVITFWVLFFLAWLALCLVKYGKWARRRKNCTAEITARVVEIKERKAMRGGMLYKPVFEPLGTTDCLLIDSAFYTNLVRFEVGQTVELLVNPADPKEFLYKDNSLNKGIVADVICCCLPLLCILGYVLVKMNGK